MSLRPRPSIRELPADLLTPVGAYLRIRDLGPGFLLESIERGQQVGRYSFLGAGCETSSSTRPRRATCSPAAGSSWRGRRAPAPPGLPPFAGGVVGLPRLRRHAPASSRPCRCPIRRAGDVAGARALPARAGRRRVRPRAARRVQVIAQPGPRGARRRDRASACPAPRRPPPCPCRRWPRAARCTPSSTREQYLRPSSASQGAHHRRRRVPDRAVAAAPAPDGAHADGRLPRTARGQPVAVHVLPRDFGGTALVGASPETHVSLDRRRHRGAAAHRRHPAARAHRRRGRRRLRGRAGRRREGARRAHDAGRPGPQRPGARLRAGHRAAVARCSRSSATRTSCTSCRDVEGRLRGRTRRLRRCCRRHVPGRHRLGRAEGAGDADHLRAGAAPPRHLRRRGRLRRLRRRDGHLHRPAHHRDARRRGASCRPARASWPTPCRSRSTRSA